MDQVYGWYEGIRNHAPDQLNRIFSEVALQIAQWEYVSEGDRSYLKTRAMKLDSGDNIAFLTTVEQTAIQNSFELEHHLSRIRTSLESDPELAIGSTKEMIESVLKTILEGFGEEADSDDLPKLLKRVQKLLNLDPGGIDSNVKGGETIKRILSSLGQIVNGIAELRNLYGTGHGKTRRSGISSRHAELVVGSGTALALFLMKTYEQQKPNI